MAKSRRSLGIRLVLALAIPTLYTAFAALSGLVLGGSNGAADLNYPGHQPHVQLSGDFRSISRHLLQINDTAELNGTDERANCTPPSINEFPSDGLTRVQRKNGFIAIHLIIAAYSFVLLAIVCDDFFVPSITKICEKIGVTKDVAGATFMAVASSSPELFINIIGTFVTHGDLGVGTIVGSAVFNILAVPACCGLFATTVLDLEWWPVSRDSLAYGVTVLLLIVTLRDGRIEWYEALVLVLAYVVYIFAMFFNTRISSCMNLFVAKRRRRRYRKVSERSPLITRDKLHDSSFVSSGKNNDNFYSSGKTRDSLLYQSSKSLGECNGVCIEVESLEISDQYSDIVNMTSWPETGCERFWWLLTWPINAVLLITIPDCRRPALRNWYPLTFIMCIAWIAVMSYIVGWDITIIGDTLGIPDSVMGLTFLAAGMSVPEAVSSVIVTNQGYGTMGISNSIGSNVFDVLLCLGLPWLVKSFFFPETPGEHFVQINSEGLIYSSVSLMSTLILLYGTLYLNRFRLDRKVGFICLGLYSVFLVFASLIELNVFFVVNRPTCDS